MARLTTKARKKLPKSTFAGPGRSYPIPDRSHAANAMARASQMVNRGTQRQPTAARIKARANNVLGR